MGFQSKNIPETIVDVREVTVDFSGFKALNELNFSIERGELRVVIGPNGAGKTTLLDVITGKLRPTSGKIFFPALRLPGPRNLTARSGGHRSPGHRPQISDS